MDHRTKSTFISSVLQYQNEYLLRRLMDDNYFNIDDIVDLLSNGQSLYVCGLRGLSFVADILFEYNIQDHDVWNNLLFSVNRNSFEPRVNEIDIIDKIYENVDEYKIPNAFLVKLPYELFKKYYKNNSIDLQETINLRFDMADATIIHLINEALDNGCDGYTKAQLTSTMRTNLSHGCDKFDMDKYVTICQTNFSDDFVEIFVDLFDVVDDFPSNDRIKNIRAKIWELLNPYLTTDIADWLYFKLINSPNELISPHISDRMKKYGSFICNFIYYRNVSDLYEISEVDNYDGSDIGNLVSFCDLGVNMGSFFPKSKICLRDLVGNQEFFSQSLDARVTFIQKILDLMEASEELNDFIQKFN